MNKIVDWLQGLDYITTEDLLTRTVHKHTRTYVHTHMLTLKTK